MRRAGTGAMRDGRDERQRFMTRPAADRSSLMRSGAGVGIAAMASRILGFLRDMLLAATLGAGPVADALLAALRLPNLLRRMLSEGAVNAGFVPLHARIAAERGEAEAAVFARNALSGAGLALIVLSALAQLAAGPLVLAMAAGYAYEPDTYALATFLNRLALPAAAFLMLAAVAGAILNARGRFRAAALAPLVVNLGMIAVLAAPLAGVEIDPVSLATALAAAFTLGGAAQLAILLHALAKARREFGERLGFTRPRLDPDMRRLLALGLPALLAAGAAQLILLAALQAASFTPSGVAHLHYADRLFQLPLGLLAAAIGIALLPAIAAGWRVGDWEGCAAALNRAMEAALLVALPAGLALALIADPIVSALFERGAFTSEDRAGTAATLAGLAIGLPFAAAAKVLGQALFAAGRMRAAALSTLFAFLVALFACAFLGARLGGLGVGLGASLAFAAHAGALAALLVARAEWSPDRRLLSRLARSAPALAALAFALVAARMSATPWSPLFLAFACIGGGALYGALALLFGAIRREDLRALSKRRDESAG